MKSLFTIILTLLSTIHLQAQECKIIPKLHVGDSIAYEKSTEWHDFYEDSTHIKITVKTMLHYCVKEKNDKGYIVKLDIDNLLIDNPLASKNDQIKTIIKYKRKLMMQHPVMYQLDKEGKVIDIINYESYWNHCQKTILESAEAIEKVNPSFAISNNKQTYIKNTLERYKKKNMIDEDFSRFSPISVFGRKIKAGETQKVGMYDDMPAEFIRNCVYVYPGSDIDGAVLLYYEENENMSNETQYLLQFYPSGWMKEISSEGVTRKENSVRNAEEYIKCTYKSWKE